MANCADDDAIVRFVEVVQHDIPRLATRKNQLPKIQFNAPTHQWMVGEYLYPFTDEGKRRIRELKVGVHEKL